MQMKFTGLETCPRLIQSAELFELSQGLPEPFKTKGDLNAWKLI